MAKDDPQVNFRLPAELRDRVQATANASKRTLTQEIVRRLEAAEDWPALSDDLRQKIGNSAMTNGVTFAQQVERDLLFANNPTYVLLADIVGSTSIRKSIEESALQRGVSFDQELLARLNSPSSSPIVDQATALKVALEYMQARHAFDAREAQVKAIQAAFEESKRAGTATEQGRIDAWNANTELVYLRRAFEGLRERFFALYRTDPRIHTALENIQAEEQRDAENAVVGDAAPKAKRKPKS